jgi:putative transposase
MEGEKEMKKKESKRNIPANNPSPAGFSTWEKIDDETDGTQSPTPPPKVDEMGPNQQERLAKNYFLVCLIKANTPPREAIQRAGLQISDSAARKLLKRFEELGISGIVDRRFGNKGPTKQIVLTPPLKKRVLGWFFARPAAGPRAIWKQIVKECRENDLTVPGYDCVKKYIQSLPEPYQLFRKGQLRIHEWERSFCPVVRFNLSTYSNERWQVDNSRLDIWVRILENGIWVPAVAHISACMCERSRSIPGFILSARDPDAWTTALLIMKAVAAKENPDWKNKGLPSVLQPDRGKTFLAHAVISSLAYLGVTLDPDPPYYPNRKGKIERWFLTLDRGCLRILPGHMDSIGRTRGAAEKQVHLLLTVPQLRKEIERWTVYDYHQQTHTETKRKPADLWEETVRLRMPESDDALRLMLLKSDKARTIHNDGISFKFGDDDSNEGHLYWSPDLTFHVGEKVQIRYNPDDRESILVYASTGQYIGEAWLMGSEDSRYNVTHVQQCRNQFRRGLQERIKDYVEEIQREDRKRASTAEWEQARSAVQPEEDFYVDDNALNEEELLEDLINQFERQDAGELVN